MVAILILHRAVSQLFPECTDCHAPSDISGEKIMTIDAIYVESSSRHRTMGARLHHGWLACRAWYIKRRTRRALAEMTEGQLHDIGITRSQARREIQKSFYWDLNA
jgi:uncharacterized protein YjiS (DUF1127 family)